MNDQILELQEKFKKINGKDAPPRYKNDIDWLTKNTQESVSMEEFGKNIIEQAIGGTVEIMPKVRVGTVLKKSIVHNGKIYQKGDICPDGLNVGDLAFRNII